MKKYLLCLILLMCLSIFPLDGSNVEIISEHNIESEDSFIQRPISFCVTEKNIIFAVDIKARNIKVIDNNGKIINTFGKKGAGPDEFMLPTNCTYSNGTLVLLDYGKRRFFFYDVLNGSDLKLKKSLKSLKMGDTAILRENKLLIAGSKRDDNGRLYCLYLQDLKENSFKYLLPIETKYGFQTYNQFKNDLMEKSSLTRFFAASFCEWYGRHAYYAWSGKPNIFKIDLETGKHITFGKETANYRPPRATPKMHKTYSTHDRILIKSEMRKMSTITGLYVAKEYIGLLYSTPVKSGDEEKSGIFLQFYRHDGTYLKEVRLPELDGSFFVYHFKLADNTLYAIAESKDEEEEDGYRLIKYKIGPVK